MKKSNYPVIVVPYLKVDAMALFPFILIRGKEMANDEVLLRHEAIHLKQEAELLILPFYVLYLINYLINRFKYKSHHEAYMNICFEREAYANEHDKDYLNTRRLWKWCRYV
ncbi:hypothetical protein [Mucilaginibacter sp. KACC 22063]|uniref:hypothetical protein n=1 Tax=Mucilaginibacter sp. KACC 22063 TaxID=3025666 RepID=UPI0023665004|nr:hypothetical protein [Mucilaginibacter sp. KACC 22063]WDF55525.1 hypothetical protein PQ461_00440 [Mucilaginibacter sp. KACC 22063]